MKRSYLKVVVLTILFTHLIVSESAAQASDSPIEYLNNFSKFTSSELNAKSALLCLQKLSTNKLGAARLPNLIHDDFAQGIVNRSFPPEMDSSKVNAFLRAQVFGKELMGTVMADTNKIIKHIINPLYLFANIQDATGDNAKLASLADRFIQEELSDPDIYSNRAGRYALMIYPILNSRPELKPSAAKLLQKVNAYLESGQIAMTENTTRDKSAERTWFRYLYAYTNFVKSEQEIDLNKKKSYLKKAFDYSPDLLDRNQNWAYFYDMVLMLNKTKDSFQEDYLDFITDNAANGNEVLSTLTQIALQQPEYKEKLKAAYSKTNGNANDFAKYWMKSVNDFAQTAPSISLSMLDKSRFSSKAGTGKWLLVDFWGTWCGPCRAEHPDMQKFYDSTIKTNPATIDLLTIACRDTEDKVTKYMNEKKFSFPVAMSDNKIEHTYKVPGYPTKLLVTPAGKYVLVPFGSDWVSFVKHYTDI